MPLLSEEQEKLWLELSNKFSEKQKDNKVKYAAFALPVKEGVIYLATRNTPPHQGFYSAIGGKIDADSGIVFENPTGSSIRLRELGFERPTTTAVRELCEEMYSQYKFPEDFSLNEFGIARLAHIKDSHTGVSCYTTVVSVPSSLEFEPSPREIGDVSKLIDINPQKINHLTRVALIAMLDNKAFSEYYKQLPPRESLPVKYFGPVVDTYVVDYL